MKNETIWRLFITWQENNGSGRSPATHYRLIHWELTGGGRSVWRCEDFCVVKYPRIIISTQETAKQYPRTNHRRNPQASETVGQAEKDGKDSSCR